MSQAAPLFAHGTHPQAVVCFTGSLDLRSWLHQSKLTRYVAALTALHSCWGIRDVQTPVLESCVNLVPSLVPVFFVTETTSTHVDCTNRGLQM